MCDHKIEVKIENGVAITYCTKCGEIFETKPVKESSKSPDYMCTTECGRDFGNGGQILHG